MRTKPYMRMLKLIPAFIVVATLSACSSQNANSRLANSSTAPLNTSSSTSISQASQDEFESLVKNLDIKSKILDQYADWKGVAYRLGGDTKRGIDCSAFVQRTFLDQFGVELPRSTSDQQFSGTQVNKSKLQAGDLVLFKTGRTMRHVGIYIGNDKFVHASTSNGVTVSEMSNTYWNKRFYAARRVIDKNDTALAENTLSQNALR
ncbi:bifunctional murein DD-endopeptidase/murein LD-carboxypeptidase [Proteus faecis]|uniref:Bifunctional murein DD-endopeptidase/murein LD-carboxypeptidase n=1 Tax=Proteus faecis TaxID=2050967 RepID=A0AAW7CNQ5_9GAMM|nr:bifunctional murein DD-endopeptidase/murein LD-carboxypeptidase [Proteus faecis]MBG3014400.1 bifunctional murein DD-endopeptidase/murein LD-carboxypeptidase [Proteus mirabilis]QNH64542.1 bifunctional murein DD-endopeptidase/murein LD-carboxypeptidase [Proteus vulgaris]MCT8248054.1 bifunctional murein DD-endopeptidase/murein LD-carboxypeptidase [Proteus faecis]MDL5165911.1 bifunctional murein DD-endopeptidase/murein LD-carboxypeptidase [Proteus faecis]MDL5273825.1 bifunctional murein DD-endo